MLAFASFSEDEHDLTPRRNSPNLITISPSGPSIASPLQKPTQHIRRSPRFAKANAHEKRDELRKIFTFLNKQKKETLRGIVKSWGKKTGGTKQVLVYRLYRFLSVVQERNRDLIDKLDQNEKYPSFSAFEKHHKECEEIWQVPPDDAELATVLGSVEISEEVRDCSSSASILPGRMQNTLPFFSVSEFARLVLILRDDDEARNALFKLGQELNRAQLDVGDTRDGFWGTIANRFNDHSLAPKFSFIGHLEGVDAAPPPVPRSAESLKHHFRDARSIFAEAVDRWSRSGQNDPYRFTDFLSRNGKVLYAASKRALILFVASKMGTANADTFFIEMTSKKIHVGGYEEGVYISSEREAKRSVPRKRASGTDSNLEAIQTLIEKVSAIGHNHPSKCSKKRSEEIEEWTDNDSMFAIVEKASRSFKTARLDLKTNSSSSSPRVGTSVHFELFREWKRRVKNKSFVCSF